MADQTKVTALVDQLHSNIDNIHACIQTLSDTSSHDAELERLATEREAKIEELRNAHRDALAQLAAQRQQEQAALEEQRKKEREDLEEQRRREYEELMARRKREDEECERKIKEEEEEREKAKKEDDEHREREREQREKDLAEGTERELERLEDEMEAKIEEGKKALRELDEKRKAINAEIEKALNAPTVIPTIQFRSRAKTLVRAQKAEDNSSLPSVDEKASFEPVKQLSGTPAMVTATGDPDGTSDLLNISEKPVVDMGGSPNPDPTPAETHQTSAATIDETKDKSDDILANSDQKLDKIQLVEEAAANAHAPLDLVSPAAETASSPSEPVNPDTKELFVELAKEPSDDSLPSEDQSGDWTVSEENNSSLDNTSDADQPSNDERLEEPAEMESHPKEIPNADKQNNLSESDFKSVENLPPHLDEPSVVNNSESLASKIEEKPSTEGSSSEETLELLGVSKEDSYKALSDSPAEDSEQRRNILPEDHSEDATASTETRLATYENADGGRLEDTKTPSGEEQLEDSVNASAEAENEPVPVTSLEVEQSTEVSGIANLESDDQHDSSSKDKNPVLEQVKELEPDLKPDFRQEESTADEDVVSAHVLHEVISHTPSLSSDIIDVAGAEAGDQNDKPEVQSSPHGIDDAPPETNPAAEGNQALVSSLEPEPKHSTTIQEDGTLPSEHSQRTSALEAPTVKEADSKLTSQTKDSGSSEHLGAQPQEDISASKNTIETEVELTQTVARSRATSVESEEDLFALNASRVRASKSIEDLYPELQIMNLDISASESDAIEDQEMAGSLETDEEFYGQKGEISHLVEPECTQDGEQAQKESEISDFKDKSMEDNTSSIESDPLQREVKESSQEKDIKAYEVTAHEAAMSHEPDDLPSVIEHQADLSLSSDLDTAQCEGNDEGTELSMKQNEASPTDEPAHKENEDLHLETDDDVSKNNPADPPGPEFDAPKVMQEPEISATMDPSPTHGSESSLDSEVETSPVVQNADSLIKAEQNAIVAQDQKKSPEQHFEDGESIHNVEHSSESDITHDFDSNGAGLPPDDESDIAPSELVAESKEVSNYNDKKAHEEQIDQDMELKSEMDVYSTDVDEAPSEIVSKHEDTTAQDQSNVSESHESMSHGDLQQAQVPDLIQNAEPEAPEEPRDAIGEATSTLAVVPDASLPKKSRVAENSDVVGSTPQTPPKDQDSTLIQQSITNADNELQIEADFSTRTEQKRPTHLDFESETRQTKEASEEESIPESAPVTPYPMTPVPSSDALIDNELASQYDMLPGGGTPRGQDFESHDIGHQEREKPAAPHANEISSPFEELDAIVQRHSVSLGRSPEEDPTKKSSSWPSPTGRNIVVDNSHADLQLGTSIEDSQLNYDPSAEESHAPLTRPDDEEKHHLDLSGTRAGSLNDSEPMTASSRGDTWVSAEEEHFQPAVSQPGMGEAGAFQQTQHQVSVNNIEIHDGEQYVAQHAVSESESEDEWSGSDDDLDHESRNLEPEQRFESFRPTPKLEDHRSHEDGEELDSSHSASRMSNEDEYLPRSTRNMETTSTAPEHQIRGFESQSGGPRPMTPVRSLSRLENHSESPHTVQDADNLFDDDDSENGESGNGDHDVPSRYPEDLADQYPEREDTPLDAVPEHEPLNEFNDTYSTHRSSGLFANLVDTIRSDLPAVRQLQGADVEARHPEADYSLGSALRPRSVSFEDPEPDYDRNDMPQHHSLHIRTQTADTVPSFESYAQSDSIPTTPSDAASSPFPDEAHDEPMIQNSWPGNGISSSPPQALRTETPKEAEFNSSLLDAYPAYINPKPSLTSLERDEEEYESFLRSNQQPTVLRGAGFNPFGTQTGLEAHRAAISPMASENQLGVAGGVDLPKISSEDDGKDRNQSTASTPTVKDFSRNGSHDQLNTSSPQQQSSNIRNAQSTPSRLPLNAMPSPSFASPPFGSSPVSATRFQNTSSPQLPPSPFPRSPRISTQVERTPTSLANSNPESLFAKTRSLFESASPQGSPPLAPSPITALSATHRSSPPPPPPPRRSVVSRPSSLLSKKTADDQEEVELMPRSLDGSGKPPSPVFIPPTSRSGSIASLRKEDDDPLIVKKSSNPFLGGLSRFVGGGFAGEKGLEDSVHNPARGVGKESEPLLNARDDF